MHWTEMIQRRKKMSREHRNNLEASEQRLQLNIRTEWHPFDPDMSKCFCCEETIYSKMMVFCATPFSGNTQWPTKPSDMKVCSSCFEIIMAE